MATGHSLLPAFSEEAMHVKALDTLNGYNSKYINRPL